MIARNSGYISDADDPAFPLSSAVGLKVGNNLAGYRSADDEIQTIARESDGCMVVELQKQMLREICRCDV